VDSVKVNNIISTEPYFFPCYLQCLTVHRMEYEHGYEATSRGPPVKKPRGDTESGHAFSLDQFLERNDEKLNPKRILLFTVFNPKFPINVEVIYKVCALVGNVRKIVCFERSNVVQAMVEFDTLETAVKARNTMHGCDIYNGCCTMKVEFSKLENLSVRENGPMSWDFQEGRGEVEINRRPVVLNNPDTMMTSGVFGSGVPTMQSKMQGGISMQGSLGMQGGLNMHGNMDGPRALAGPGLGGGGSGSIGVASGGMMMPGLPRNMGMMGGIAEQLGGGGYHEESGYRANSMNMGGYHDEGKSCVLLVYGLKPPNWNCAKVFNLLCQYGNVNKIFFMKTKSNTAMVEMGNHEGLDNVVRNLQEVTIFGEKLKFHMSKNHIRINNPPPEYTLADGSPSVKEYFSERNLNRFVTPDLARKNRIIRPSAVLHFFNIMKVSDAEVEELFRKANAPLPQKIKWVNTKQDQAEDPKQAGVGLAYFTSVEVGKISCHKTS
jgi:heterogeneous nuclear ribonucleoprotein L